MKNLIIATILIIFMQGCRVCQISYRTNADLNKEVSPLAKDSVTFTCGLVSTDNKRIHLLVRFYDKVQQQRVNAIKWTIITDDKIDLTLDKVSMVPAQYWHNSSFEDQHTAKSFALLPDDFKLTSLDGQVVYYDFDYVNNHRIKSKKLNISLEIELQNGKTIKFKDDFISQKNCYFSVH